MAKTSIRITRSAAEKSRNKEVLRKAALSAFEKAGRGDIFCLPLEVNGQKFALSSRIVIEVDWLPNRIPPRVLRETKAAKCRKRWP